MKIPNYLTTSLAFVGAVSLIIMACSTNSATDSSTNVNSTNSLGKYQLSADGSLHVLDTETGIVKTYGWSGNNSYIYQCTTKTQ